jgi:hypothetical protein
MSGNPKNIFYDKKDLLRQKEVLTNNIQNKNKTQPNFTAFKKKYTNNQY